MKIHRVAVAFIGISLVLLLNVRPHDGRADAEGVPTLLRAQAIELVDGHGQVRAQLIVDESTGEVDLKLRDANGTIRAKLGASETGSGLLLVNEKTELGAHIVASRARTSLTLQRDARRRVLRP